MNNRENTTIHPEAVAMDACAWIAKLDRGMLSKNDAKGLRDWLAESYENRAALATQLEEWSDMDVLSELSRLDLNYQHPSLLSKFLHFWNFSKHPRFWGATYSLGALLLLTILVLNQQTPLSFSAKDQVAVQIGISTSVGEQKTESLPDGSLVHVNTRSSAEISYTEEERTVILHAGEAFFDVAPEADRPFVVYVDDTAVRAIGTAFAVHKTGDTISVSVTEGTVELVSGGISTRIAANEPTNGASSPIGNVAIHANEKTSVSTQPADVLERRLGWQDGMLEFRGESLGQVVEELSRYTQAQIIIVDEDIKDIRLGGYFKVGDIEGLASTLALGFNIDVDVVSTDLIQLSRRIGNSESE